ncbi:PKD domain-containing protein [Tellurirhabdus bombi]|uniref:PKD domain-containing protein n=1 Tax=Tellurirhabdus bombi TaxID=2907205 RepID=UPI001F365E4A|nr:PKD domain-containing protein [Tellurirhabdus bombi]
MKQLFSSSLFKSAYLLFFWVIAISCQPKITPKPVADFSFESVPNEPGRIKFINRSQHATRYQWNFGDGQSSTESDPTIKYGRNGLFSVELTAKNTAGTDVANNSVLIEGVTVSGSVIFWTNSRGDGSDIEVQLDGQLKGAITSAQPSGNAPGCGTDGFVTVYTSNGTFSYYAKSKTKSWSGVVTVQNGTCTNKLLAQ